MWRKRLEDHAKCEPRTMERSAPLVDARESIDRARHECCTHLRAHTRAHATREGTHARGYECSLIPT